MSGHIPSPQDTAHKTLRSKAMSLPFWRQLRWNLIFYFVLLATLPVSIVAYVILVRTSAQATNQVYDQLDSVAELKNAQILRWLGEGQSILSPLVAGSNQDRVTAFITAQTPTPQEQADLNNILIDAVGTGYFNKLFVYNAGGRVLASSDPADIGTMVDNQPYFEVSLYANYTQPPVADPTTGQMVMYMTRPLRIGKSDAIGVLAGRLNIDTLAEIMTERTGLGESGETYLVSLDNRYMWTPSRFAGYEMTHAYYSQGIDQALSGKTGRGAYDNYRSPAVPVFGSYRFIPELRAGLLAEVEQSQAMNTFGQVQLLGIGVAAVATLAAIVLGLLVARQISGPMIALTETAARIAGGDLSIRSTVQGQNEVGVLAAAFNTMTDQLQDLIDSLESRVQTRTAQLQAGADVGRVASSILDTEQLLREVVTLIGERFNFYYVAIFLVDESGHWAVLREATGEAGRLLLAQGHKLEVGGQSMVGYATSKRESRIALDVGSDAVRFANPLLPYSRSEIVLPLLVGDRVIGAMDVQSTEPAAFDENYATLLQGMADQVAVAMNNAVQFKQTALQARQQSDLNQFSRNLYAAITATDLYRVLATQLNDIVPHDYLSLTFAQSGSDTLREYPLQAEAASVLTEGPVWETTDTLSGRAYTTRQPVVSAHLAQDAVLDDAAQLERAGFESALSLPLIVGERVLGTLNFASRKPEAFSLSGSTQLEQLAGQVAVALENQRLAQAQQTSLREMEALTRQLTGQAWAKRRQRQAVESVQYARSGVDADLPASAPEIETAMEQRAPIARSEPGNLNGSSPYQAALAVPIVLRGEVLGGLQVGEARQAREWTENDLTFMQAVADQVALALDNARLIEETERRAERERVVADISSRMFAANDLETIVQIAGEELGRILQVDRTEVKLSETFSESTTEAITSPKPN